MDEVGVFKPFKFGPIAVLLLVSGTAVDAMSFNPGSTEYRNEIGLGVSYGVKLDKDATFWGYAPDYVRTFGKRWIFNLSLAYDEETEEKIGGDSVVETWTPSVIIGYQLNQRMAVGAGVGHGLFENDNSGGWQSVKLGDDVSLAVAFAVTLWSKDRHGLSLSVSLEQSLSDNEPSISTDIGYSWGF